MKRLIFVFAMAALVACGSKNPMEESVNVEKKEDKLSYAMGVYIGQDIAKMLKMQGQDSIIDKSLLVRGLYDAILEKETAIPAESAKQVVSDFLREQDEDRRKAQMAQFEGIRQEGENFLAANKEKAGVTTTLSGLQYEVMKAGKGPNPKLGDSVEVHYVGTLLNGTKFDSSVDRGETFKFEVAYGGLIEGWIEGVQLMNEGAKFRFWLPYGLAYGDRGAGQDIPPFSALVFEIELIKLTPKK
ncbi:MAG TPA: FKBP-type peptidyl-prolyl cis-trans isomerase [Flavobacteriales bacterium]|nr:FKBP-type peptidyl-prolyl cis-trans isomerase [Flavobacteriales bacterium]HRJ34446.1 FKBP-type peptidyl-prolyl cis-trans isomerase [Flavobacteriales bacterium]HRJ39527.1 FKBP-type peptidyl-prolyl cis-trans isomerase [Flavobacteriales bacterium]